jgi:hypothetical protein
MADHKRNGDTGNILAITCVNAIIKRQKERLEHLGRIRDKRIPKLFPYSINR